MPRTEFGWYHGRWVRDRSSAYAFLAALLLDAALVVLLLHIPLHVELVDRHSPTPETMVPRQVVAYLTLSPTNQVSTGADRITKSPHTASATSNVSRPRVPTVVDAVTAPTDTLAGSLRSSRETSPMRFQTFRPSPVEQPQAEVIDSIIRTIIQPGNDSAVRVGLALRNAVDWTVAVKGERYGMSPGELHFGKISIRFPVVFAEPLSFSSDRRREFRRISEETRSQAARAARDAAFDSAVASIRLRRLAGKRPRPNSRLESERN
jgi:hypothetical protein